MSKAKLKAWQFWRGDWTAYVVATEVEAAAIEGAINESNTLLNWTVVGGVQFHFTWHPRTHPKTAKPDAKRGRPNGLTTKLRSGQIGDSDAERRKYKLHALHISRATDYRVRRKAFDEQAARAGAEWIAPPLSRRGFASGNWPARRRIGEGILSHETISLRVEP